MNRLVTTLPAIKDMPDIARRKRVCAYVRVSTNMRAQIDSLENQTRYYNGLIRSKLDWEFAGIFSDAGISGAKENRPGLIEMMTKASQGEIDLILTKSLSRFARNTLLMLKSIRHLKDLGVAVEFEKEGINTLRAEGELLLSILASIAEEERKQISTNLKWAFRNKFKRGEEIGRAHV